ncbi:hypothetical protein P691DRAFT_774274 [Macrolepiota fuliginosa MF-IS2]|uniref:Uncharacterized protein n=1 Tax=Macrolepiota fuliginosa MF-IS2 TaxID=1400762 RepID=A0A9P6C3D9_9AGAR|nr:hypothetical protein P691DRAFT_774274 [Macrolepiota fuliginosa MF-IS2]
MVTLTKLSIFLSIASTIMAVPLGFDNRYVALGSGTGSISTTVLDPTPPIVAVEATATLASSTSSAPSALPSNCIRCQTAFLRVSGDEEDDDEELKLLRRSCVFCKPTNA